MISYNDLTHEVKNRRHCLSIIPNLYFSTAWQGLRKFHKTKKEVQKRIFESASVVEL